MARDSLPGQGDLLRRGGSSGLEWACGPQWLAGLAEAAGLAAAQRLCSGFKHGADSCGKDRSAGSRKECRTMAA